MIAKLYFSENDLQDMLQSFYKEEGLWNTWNYHDSETDTQIRIELHLKENEEID